MKVKEYLSKHFSNYSIEDSGFVKFHQNPFIEDFANEFYSLLEISRMRTEFNINHFDEVISKMDKKWESIDNKLGGNLPYKLWNWFYYNHILVELFRIFPKIKELNNSFEKMSHLKLCEKISGMSYIGADDPNYYKDNWKNVVFDFNSFLESCENRLDDFYNKCFIKKPATRIQKIAFDVYSKKYIEYHIKCFWNKKSEHERFEKNRSSRTNDWDFWKYFFGGFNRAFIPQKIKPTDAIAYFGLIEPFTRDMITKKFQLTLMSKQAHPDQNFGEPNDEFIKIVEYKNKLLKYIE